METSFPIGSAVKNQPATVGDAGSIPGLGRFPGEGNSNPFQYSCWRIPWTEELSRLQSMGPQGIGRNLATDQQ